MTSLWKRRFDGSENETPSRSEGRTWGRRTVPNPRCDAFGSSNGRRRCRGDLRSQERWGRRPAPSRIRRPCLPINGNGMTLRGAKGDNGSAQIGGARSLGSGETSGRSQGGVGDSRPTRAAGSESRDRFATGRLESSGRDQRERNDLSRSERRQWPGRNQFDCCDAFRGDRRSSW
jgi:hypothetical protein